MADASRRSHSHRALGAVRRVEQQRQQAVVRGHEGVCVTAREMVDIVRVVDQSASQLPGLCNQSNEMGSVGNHFDSRLRSDLFFGHGPLSMAEHVHEGH